MPTVKLTKGFYAKIDATDVALLGPYNWSACPSESSHYARARLVNTGGVVRWERMHRFIMGLEPGDERVVDHINGDTLDNRRINLRIVTRQKNNENRTRPQSNNTSGFLGAERTASGKFASRIKRGGKRYRLGLFNTPQEAHAKYKEFASAN